MYCRRTSRECLCDGHHQSANFPTTKDALQRMRLGGEDAFVTKLNTAGTDRLYSTYLGGVEKCGPKRQWDCRRYDL